MVLCSDGITVIDHRFGCCDLLYRNVIHRVTRQASSRIFFSGGCGIGICCNAFDGWHTLIKPHHGRVTHQLLHEQVSAATDDCPVGRSARDVLYQGIAARTFERSFQLADHVEVKGASLENGLLHVDLVREIPEAMKPRSIPIASSSKLLEVKPTKVAA